MANRLYDKGREKFLKGSISWNSDNIKVIGVSAGYTPNFATNEFLSDISGGDIVCTSGNLASKTTSAGVADAADFAFSTVSGAEIVALVIYKDTGTGSTSALIGWIDTAANLPKTPDGSDIDVVFDNGSNKIFKL